MFPPDTKHASCTAIKGQEYRALLPQWIEHHHNIGVEHIFVYVNEPFADIDMFYAKPYVTYIPFDYQFKPFYFQATWQNDCIYRAKNASVAWVGLHDIDEYWQPLEAPYNMDTVMRDLDPDFDVGMHVLNTWYGPNPDEYETFDMHKRPGKLLMDYSWKSPDHRGPWKNIVSPKLVEYYYVHWVTKEVLGSRPLQKFPWAIQMNHYRRPYDHVHSFDPEREGFDSTREVDSVIQKDESMSKQFKEAVLRAIEEADPTVGSILSIERPQTDKSVLPLTPDQWLKERLAARQNE